MTWRWFAHVFWLWRGHPASNRLAPNARRDDMTKAMFGKFAIVGVIGVVIGVAVSAAVTAAAPEFNTRGNRFKPLSYEELTPEQRAYADKEIAEGRRPDNGP